LACKHYLVRLASLALMRCGAAALTQGARMCGWSCAHVDGGCCNRTDYNHPFLGAGFGPGHKVVGGYDFVGDEYTGKCRRKNSLTN
jgi:hypothetical protein